MKPRALDRSSWCRTAVLTLAAATMLATAGCSTAHYTINPPLARPAAQDGYRLGLAARRSDDPRTFVHLSISGGGLRAAAFAYGVVEGLAGIRLPDRGPDRPATLWQAVDVMSAVSGGALLAGYVAAFGAEAVDGFVPSVLEADVESALLSAVLSPAGLWRLTSPRFGRSDLLERVLDARVYRGRRFSDASPDRPFVIVAASDMRSGERFEFTQDRFDALCSDLGALPIARAVAASAAVPIVLSPITLWRYAGRCARGLPADDAAPDGYVHLVDGGLADNLASRVVLDANRGAGVVEIARRAGYRAVSRVVFIVVDAETAASWVSDDSADVPGILRSALALADIPINHVSSQSRSALADAVLDWQAQARLSASRGALEPFAPDVEFHLVRVALRDWPDEALTQVPTRLEMAPDVTRALRHAGCTLVRRSDELRAVLRSWGAEPPAAAACVRGAHASTDGAAP